jgi:alkylation response protein AidB-like acyl-CoA dehydrogenase
VKGISLFLVPKFLPDADGNPARQRRSCAAIEHKMGIKASATCQMVFEDSLGWLVGEANKGLEAMFTMMNAERVGVGIQGLGVGEAAYQSAVWYAGTGCRGARCRARNIREKDADSIIVHPDVRRMLTMRAITRAAARGLGGARAGC